MKKQSKGDGANHLFVAGEERFPKSTLCVVMIHAVEIVHQVEELHEVLTASTQSDFVTDAGS